MKLALLALFAFTVPAPFAETFTTEEEVVVQSTKTAVRPLAPEKQSTSPSPTPVTRPAFRRTVADLPSRSLIEWTPAVFTRPPPRT